MLKYEQLKITDHLDMIRYSETVTCMRVWDNDQRFYDFCVSVYKVLFCKTHYLPKSHELSLRLVLFCCLADSGGLFCDRTHYAPSY